MSFIPKITCRKCKRQYSGLSKKCPHCSAVRQTTSTKAATTSDRAKDSAATNENAKWQFAFGITVVSAVMLSVVVLITSNLDEVGGNSDSEIADPIGSAPPIAATPTPLPTPTPTPVTPPDSIDIYFLTEPSEGFTLAVGDSPLKLDVQIFPLTVTAPVEWISSDTAIFTVDSTGSVTAVGPGSGTLTVSCAGVTDSIPVYVKAVTS